MEFQYIKLYLYKRFPLSDSDYFEHIFTKKVTQIVGRNGSGKSSLVNELTALPADKNDFHKGGYKEIGIAKAGNAYVIRSDFSEGSKFSFICNNEELNPSGNVTRQRELAYQHFQINDVLHSLLTGAETFTDMSQLARKKLFNLITHLNIDELLDYYNDIKNKEKVTELFLKSQTTLYHTERQKLLDREKIDEVKETHTRVRAHAEILLELWSYFKQHANDQALTTIYEKINTIQQEINNLYRYNYTTITSIPFNDIASKTIQYTADLNSTKYRLDLCYKELNKKQEVFRVLQIANKTNLSTLQSQLKETEMLIEKYRKSCGYLKLEDLTDLTRTSIYKIETLLPDLLYELPLNTNRTFSKEKYEQALEDKQKTLQLVATLTEDILKHKRMLADFVIAANVVCPKCQTTIKDETSLAKQQTIQTQLKQLELNCHTANESLKKTNTYLQEFSEYMVIYRQIITIKKETQDLTSYWNTFNQSELIYTEPSSLVSSIRQLKQDLLNLDEAIKLNANKVILLKDIEVLKSVDTPDQQILQQEMNFLEHEITSLIAESTCIIEHLKTIEQTKLLYHSLEQLKHKLKTSETELYNVNFSYLANNLLETIESELSKAKINIIELERILHDDKSIHDSLLKYETTINATKEDLDVLAKILLTMSPKNGFIAKTVSGFLNLLITHINSTINRVWSYSMTIKPIDVEADALNYKFKVDIEGRHSVDDVAKVSMGMKEIINLSFRLMLYRLLGLNGYPIWMDELASAMDVEHTSKMSVLINELIMSDRYSQLFLITHKENFSHIKELDIINLGI